MGCPTAPPLCWLGSPIRAGGGGRSFHPPPETREDHPALDHVDHLGNAQGVRVIGEDDPLLLKAHLYLADSVEPIQGPLDPADSAGADHPRDSELRSKMSHRSGQAFRLDQPGHGGDSQISQPHVSASNEGHRCFNYSSRSAVPGQRESIRVFRFPDHPSRLLKKAHLRRWRARAALRRTDRVRLPPLIPRRLASGPFEQPGRKRVLQHPPEAPEGCRVSRIPARIERASRSAVRTKTNAPGGVTARGVRVSVEQCVVLTHTQRVPGADCASQSV